MNKKSKTLIWSILCIPLILYILMYFGYDPDEGVPSAYLWLQMIVVLSGIFLITKISIKHLGLKILTIGLYVVGVLFYWLSVAITVGCNNGGGCFVH